MPSLEKFLARLTEEARRPFPAYNVAAIFAQPSEIIAGAATLRRLRGAHLVVVTDGVPHGYQECGALSASGTRWHELLAAAELDASNFAADVEEFRLVPHKEPLQARKVFTCVDEDFLSGAGALEEDFGRQAKAQA